MKRQLTQNEFQGRNMSAIILMVSGILWAMLGVANIALMDYSHPMVANHLGEAIMFNVWWFIAPGAALLAFGWWWRSRLKANPTETTSS